MFSYITLERRISRKEAIRKVRDMVCFDEFRKKIKGVANSYGSENSSDLIIPVLNPLSVRRFLEKKFYDLPDRGRQR
jgi:hypothetical protein